MSPSIVNSKARHLYLLYTHASLAQNTPKHRITLNTVILKDPYGGTHDAMQVEKFVLESLEG